MDHLERAGKCLQVLAICGTVDPVAAKFSATLKHYLDGLKTLSDEPQKRIPEVHKLKTELYRLVLMPFDRVEKDEFSGAQADELGLALYSHIDLADTIHPTLKRRSSSLEEKTGRTQIESVLGGLRPANVTKDFASCGWW